MKSVTSAVDWKNNYSGNNGKEKIENQYVKRSLCVRARACIEQKNKIESTRNVYVR